jgi:hypothetical protein
MCTISNLLSLLTNADTIIAVTVHAANDKYVCKIARSCSGPSTRAELKLGQKIHKNTDPTMANKSDVYEAPSSSPGLAFSFDGLRIKLAASPK